MYYRVSMRVAMFSTVLSIFATERSLNDRAVFRWQMYADSTAADKFVSKTEVFI